MHALGNLYAKHAFRIPAPTTTFAISALRTVLVVAVSAIRDGKATNETRRVVSSALRTLHVLLDAATVPPATGGHINHHAGGGETESHSSSFKVEIPADVVTNLVDAVQWCIFRAKSDPWLAAMTFRAPPLTVAAPSPLVHKISRLRLAAASTSRGSVAQTTPAARDSAPSPSPSESEFSDADLGGGGGLREPAAKIRYSALLLLGTLAVKAGRGMFAHWDKLLAPAAISSSAAGSGGTSSSRSASPITPTPLQQQQQQQHQFGLLLGVMRADPSTRVRVLAATDTANLLRGSGTYLATAVGAPGTGSADTSKSGGSAFTSLSERLAQIVAEIHAACVECLTEEVPAAEGIQLVKTFSTLATTTLYPTQRPLAFASFAATMFKLAHSSPDRPVATIAVSAVADTILATCSAAGGDAPVIPGGTLAPFWRDLLNLVAPTALVPATSSPTTLVVLNNVPPAAWTLLTCLARDPQLPPEALVALDRLLRIAISSHTAAAAPVVPVFLAAVAAHTDPQFELGSGGGTVGWWAAAVHALVVPLLSTFDPFPERAASGLDAVATVPAAEYAKLQRGTQALLMSAVVTAATSPVAASATAAAAEDDSPGSVSPSDTLQSHQQLEANVTAMRAAGCRVIGVMVGFADLCDDDTFLADSISALLSSYMHAAVLVRARCAWSLANLAQVLYTRSTSPTAPLPRDVARQLSHLVAAAQHHAAADVPACRGNGARALGPMYAAMLASHPSQRPMSSTQDQVLSTLAAAARAGPVKQRWNACVALRPVLVQLIVRRDAVGAGAVAMALVAAVKAAGKNFKVRIHATAALAEFAAFSASSEPVSADIGQNDARDKQQVAAIAERAVRQVAELFTALTVPGGESTPGSARQYYEEWREWVLAAVDGVLAGDERARVRATVVPITASSASTDPHEINSGGGGGE
ncbi:hypothetical protein BC828DRAFT_390915 [Blastocladiella britannica]|nr:hypothetical protein BC828DRAFT_390915 [Blastocladiella britannica]